MSGIQLEDSTDNNHSKDRINKYNIYECKALIGKALIGKPRYKREERERERVREKTSTMPYWTKLEILVLLDCIALPIALALA